MKTLLKQRHHALFTLLFILCAFIHQQGNAQGTWDSVKAFCRAPAAGGLVLLSDGTVMVKTTQGGSDNIGNTYCKLTPDTAGSYANGRWSLLTPMKDTRLYYATQVLRDGRVFVAGGEYGTGAKSGEVYDPVANTWTPTPDVDYDFFDANSEILPDGRVLVGMVGGITRTVIYNPSSNTYTHGGATLVNFDESAWVKLADNSILFADPGTNTAERYFAGPNKWIAAGSLPVRLYDSIYETGPGFLLPDGRAFFLGGTGHTAYYTPRPGSGSTPGVWSAGPDIPFDGGTLDASGAMMANGRILCTVSKKTGFHHQDFPGRTYFYVYSYLNNTFKKLSPPAGGPWAQYPTYTTTMLNLPDGSVLLSIQGSSRLYIFKPLGLPLAAGKPTIAAVAKNGNNDAYTITGTLFNGITEGAAYGDDWQMATNYPIVRLTSGKGRVYYARTYNWNRTGVMTDNLPDTVQVEMPRGLRAGKYAMQVIVNGNPSDAYRLIYAPSVHLMADGTTDQLQEVRAGSNISIYPNPVQGHATIQYNVSTASHISMQVYDMGGRLVTTLLNGNATRGLHTLQVNTGNMVAGMYLVKMVTADGTKTEKLLIK